MQSVPGQPSESSQAAELRYWEKCGFTQMSAMIRLYERVFGLQTLDFRQEKILDCGSGPRSIFEEFAPVGAHVIPVDPLANEYNALGLATKFPIRREIPPERFTLISCLNVLDHMEAPVELLEVLAKHLEPNGRFWFYVNVDRPFSPLEHPQCFRAWQLPHMLSRFFQIERAGLLREMRLFPYALWAQLTPHHGRSFPVFWTFKCSMQWAWFWSVRAAVKLVKVVGLRRLLPEGFRF